MSSPFGSWASPSPPPPSPERLPVSTEHASSAMRCGGPSPCPPRADASRCAARRGRRSSRHPGAPAPACTSTGRCLDRRRRHPVLRLRRRPACAPHGPRRGAAPLTAAGPSYGGLRVQSGRLLAVREDLSAAPHRRAIVEIPVDGSAADEAAAVRVIAEGTGFFAHPALSPDGSRVAWVEWQADSMPWESAVLAIGAVDGGTVTRVPTSAALQPEWSGDDALVFADDASGRWQLQHLALDGLRLGASRALTSSDADTGYGLWVLGNRWFQVLADGRLVAVRTNGRDEVQLVSADGETRAITVPGDGHLSVDDVAGSRVLLSGDGSRVTSGIWCVDVDRGPSRPSPVALRSTRTGCRGAADRRGRGTRPRARVRLSARRARRPPRRRRGAAALHRARARRSDRPCHRCGLRLHRVLHEPGHRGPRRQLRRIDGIWTRLPRPSAGTVGHRRRGRRDRGGPRPRGRRVGRLHPHRHPRGSAGGWTVLSALVRGGTFAAGISRYGVADLRLLAAETHDFEASYLDGLVGPLPRPRTSTSSARP